MTDAATALSTAWNGERRRIVASISRRLGDLDAAEDALQDAVRSALEHWERDGVPANPGAWLMTAAWRRALDGVRANRRIDPGSPVDEADAASARQGDDGQADELRHDDDIVVMLLACTHPALPAPDAVALALRHVSGFPVDRVASVFLVEAAAMQKRLVRIRRRLREAGVALERPRLDELGSRLPAARSAVLLAFTLGHTPPSGDRPVLVETCDEAVWLARQLHALDEHDDESTGLLALLLLLRARLDSRTEPLVVDGAVVAEEGILAPAQDPNRWDAALIAEAKALLVTTGRTPPGSYRLQAAIALAHTRPGGPDWPLVAELHAALRRAAPSSTALVNHAFAAGRADGPDAGLRLIAEAKADPRLARYAPLHAVEASLLDDAGRPEQAAAAWQRALELVDNTAHRRLIEQRLRSADETGTDPRARRSAP